jgi:hypothetical protein
MLSEGDLCGRRRPRKYFFHLYRRAATCGPRNRNARSGNTQRRSAAIQYDDAGVRTFLIDTDKASDQPPGLPGHSSVLLAVTTFGMLWSRAPISDLAVAVAEDLVAIAGGLLIVSRL